MMQTKPKTQSMTVKTLVPFLALTFGLAWGIAALLIFFTDQMVAIFGEITNSNPLYILMAYSPGIAGAFLVWRHYGLKGLGSFFRRLTLWRMPRVWWLYLIVGIPIIAYLAAALNGTISDPFPYSPWYLVFPALAQAFFLLGTIELFPPGYHRGVWLAGAPPTSAAAQDGSLLGWLNRGYRLGYLAPPCVSVWGGGCIWRLVRRAILWRRHRCLHHPHSHVQ
jgi:hypothetical protein